MIVKYSSLMRNFFVWLNKLEPNKKAELVLQHNYTKERNKIQLEKNLLRSHLLPLD